jgi:Tfp pilus assembly protein FimV
MTRPLHTALLLVGILLGSSTTAPGQGTLAELGAANAARNDMMSNSAGAATAAAPEQPRPAPVAAVAQTASYGMKYTLSYALAGLLLGLGMYLVCRPSHRHEAD